MFSVHMLITDFFSLIDWDSDMATLLLLLHLLPPTAGLKKRTKISPSDAADKMVLFHKVNSL